ncbi:MAG: hypothetical protein H6Q90_3976 [Deltaproteobacteria bacterium]|nr:hypothetical protein [Deltaproteobacteria bacterium]
MRAVLLLTVLALTACKGDPVKCEQASRNFATLTYWSKANAEIAKLPPEQRQAMRKRKLGDFTNELETRIDLIVSQCQSANNEEQIDCMIAAKTAEQALACAELAPDAKP